MIPADVASQLRTILPEKTALLGELNKAPQPTARLLDVLNNLVPGQRLLAEIQTILPNGAYRAMVGQRELTLALPFAAKSGDTLELEVVGQEGNLSLAFVGKRNTTESSPPPSQSVSTQLSKTGNLIGELLIEVEQQGGKAKPALLNGNQPLLEAPPSNAKDIAPVLKQALHASGMFYEAHQARWVKGQLPTSSLLSEPQGKLSTLRPNPAHSRTAENTATPARMQDTGAQPPANQARAPFGSLEHAYHPQSTLQQTLTPNQIENFDGDTTVSLSPEATQTLSEIASPFMENSTDETNALPPQKPSTQTNIQTAELPSENGATGLASEGEPLTPTALTSSPAPQTAAPLDDRSPQISVEEAKAQDVPQQNAENIARPKADPGHSKLSAEEPAAFNQAQAGSRETSSTALSPASTNAPEAPAPRHAIAPELTPLVQQQLNALATQTYVWQGMIWPGQSMQWEITEDDGRPRSTPDEFPSRWQTRLRLDLPNLGSIDARLRLGNTGALELDLTTDNLQSERLLRAAGQELASALQTAGLTLNKFTANHGEPPPG